MDKICRRRTNRANSPGINEPFGPTERDVLQVLFVNTPAQNIYIIGIGGTGTGALAGLLKQAGHNVWGSDTALYPPMSDRLAAWGIVAHQGYDAAHLIPPPDKVVVGNVIRATNAEAVYAREHGLPTLSMPQAVATYGIGDRHSIVMAGTHGKTTTTALAAHLLTAAGKDPGYLIGGAPVGGGPSAHLGQGDCFVVEGDEYDTAYFDKGPKFLHYRAKTAVITSLEFDHADIFKDLKAVQAAFARLIETVPQDGTLVVWHGATAARELITAQTPCKNILVYAQARPDNDDAQLYMAQSRTDADGLHFEAVLYGKSLGPMRVPLWGSFSACNVLAALGAVCSQNLTPAQLAHGFATFPGVRRRMEVVSDAHGVVVVDDFGHHPTAVQVTLAAAKERFVNRRIWAIFEPRSATSRRHIFESAYVDALAGADCVVVAHHERLQEIAEGERFSPERVAKHLGERGKHAWAIQGTAQIVALLHKECRPGDVVMVLSNGDFDGLIGKLIATLAPTATQGNA
jgi:UDP-N-acetylmuramate: L-alanyl-gamma-D-glutamyl-meso-diaminopimelate ligase